MAEEKERKKKRLNEKERNKLYALTPEDIKLSKLKEMFAYKKDKLPDFNPSDTFRLPKGKFHNKSQVDTTVGRYIFNLHCLTPEIIKHTGYINKTLDKTGMRSLEDRIGNLLLEDKIDHETYIEFINKYQWLGFSMNQFLASTLTSNMLQTPDKVKKKKEELIKNNREELDKGNIEVIDKIEKKLMDDAKKEIEDIPDYEIYASGCRGSYENNYKNSSLIRGAIARNNSDEYYISKSNLVDGMKKEDYPAYSDLVVSGSYMRGVQTAEGGYEGKKLSAVGQTVAQGEKGSDCDTEKTLELEITNHNSDLILYRYIIERGKKVLLTKENIDNYIGKKVKLRSPMYCTNDKICNICAGELYGEDMLDIPDWGLLFYKVGTSIMYESINFSALKISLIA